MRNNKFNIMLKIKTQWITDEERLVAPLPLSWRTLKKLSFHNDLMERAQAHAAYAKKHGFSQNAQYILEEVGKGFLTPFNPKDFTQETQGLRTKAMSALVELSNFYENRIPSLVWNSFAHLATREDPEVEKSIIKEASSGKLPHHYTIVDSCLHASGLVYTFMLHVNSVMFKHTGRILNHNCDCSCSLINLEEIDGVIKYELPQKSIITASQSVLTHFLAETVKLQQDFLPFAYSITPEAKEIQCML